MTAATSSPKSLPGCRCRPQPTPSPQCWLLPVPAPVSVLAATSALALALPTTNLLALALAVVEPLVLAPAVIEPSQSTSAAEASKAVLVPPLQDELRDLVCPVSHLPHVDSVVAAPSTSLVDGCLGHSRPPSGKPCQSWLSGSAAGRGRALITAPSNCPHLTSQPSKRATGAEKNTPNSLLKPHPLIKVKFQFLQWNCCGLHAN